MEHRSSEANKESVGMKRQRKCGTADPKRAKRL